MLSQPEYLANLATLENTALRHQDELTTKLTGETDIRRAVKVTLDQTSKYNTDFGSILANSLAETGNTSVDHYDRELDLKLSNAQKQEIVASQIMRQTTDRYYGATLDERLNFARLENDRRVMKSAVVGKTLPTRLLNLSRVFAEPYPHGSHFSGDRRLMLGQCVKLEHDIAMHMAGLAEVRVVKWTLSHRHKVRDICDEYAEHYDKEVARYLRDRNIRVNPKGCYFVDDAPAPPHPNCQCHLRMVYKGGLTSAVVERAKDFIQDLLGRLRGRRHIHH